MCGAWWSGQTGSHPQISTNRGLEGNDWSVFEPPFVPECWVFVQGIPIKRDNQKIFLIVCQVPPTIFLCFYSQNKLSSACWRLFQWKIVLRLGLSESWAEFEMEVVVSSIVIETWWIIWNIVWKIEGIAATYWTSVLLHLFYGPYPPLPPSSLWAKNISSLTFFIADTYLRTLRFDTIFYMASLDSCPETILDQVI
jgi:hypothetical protein